MPRYHLHIRNGQGLIRDEDGQEFADDGEALEAATTGARSLLSAEVAEGLLDLRGRIEVTGAQGTRIMDVHFRDVVEIIDGELPTSANEGEQG